MTLSPIHEPAPARRPLRASTAGRDTAAAAPSAAPFAAPEKRQDLGGLLSSARRRRALLELGLLAVALAADLWWLRDLSTQLPSQFAQGVIVALVLVSVHHRHGGLRNAMAARHGSLRAWMGPLLFTLAVGLSIALLGAALRAEPYDELRLFALSWAPAERASAASSAVLRALLQQATLFGLVWPASRDLIRGRRSAQALAAGVFAAAHLPHPVFAAATFLVAWCWIELFRRGGGFLALVVSHALLSPWAYAQLPERALHDLHVGSKAMERAANYRALASEPRRQLLREICAPEYLARFATAEAYVEAVHPQIFGRTATAEEIAVWAEKARRRSLVSTAKMMVMYEAESGSR